MASQPTNYQQNVHQVELTVAWSLIVNVSVVCAVFKHDKSAALAHLMFGCIILLLCYTFIIYFLQPYGFNANTLGWWFYAHGILGCMMLGFSLLQVMGGFAIRFLQHGKTLSVFSIKLMKRGHQIFGLFLAVLYKINIIWAWYGFEAFTILIIWDGLWIVAYILLKALLPRLQRKVKDPQINNFICPEIKRIADVEKVIDNYVIFGSYVYDARELAKIHPGGAKVIQLVKGREVDRFLYGMYSAQLFPQLPPHDHSAFCLQLAGHPIAKLVTAPTYKGFSQQVAEGKIKYLKLLSPKTQIYTIGIILKDQPLQYLGYSDLRQLGQFYSFTINNKVTRLYTAVNFLTHSNIDRMTRLLQAHRESSLKRVYEASKVVKSQTELPTMFLNTLKQRLEPEKQIPVREQYLPLMMKVYGNGKCTSYLKQSQFFDVPVKLSIPRGKGLQLQSTAPGRIIVLTGGTGLFPFSDLIDLLFKSQLIEENHQMSDVLLEKDPLLRKKPFKKFHFVFLIAINEPEDIHPITLAQLIKISKQQTQVKVVFRVSKNPQKLQKQAQFIQFTREYFNKRILMEASIEGLSRIWICGPPKLNTDIANILLENGYSHDSFLLL